MKKLLVGLFILYSSAALAQWQVPNGSIPLGKGPGVIGFGSISPSSIGCLSSDGTTWTGGGCRRVLTANTTFFVSTTGTDNSTCGVTLLTACLNASQAYVNVQRGYDARGFNVTILEAAGTYTTSQIFGGPILNAGAVIIGGASNGSAIHNTASPSCIEAYEFATISIVNVTIQGCTLGIAASKQHAHIFLGAGIVFGAMSGAGSAHIYTSRQSYVETFAPYTISGDADSHIVGSHQGNFRSAGQNTGATLGTLTAGLNFNSGFVAADSDSDITFTGYAGPPYDLNGHTVAGPQWSCGNNGLIQNLYPETVPSFFPGIAGGPIKGNCAYNQGLHLSPTISSFGSGSHIGTDYLGRVNEGVGSLGGTVTFTNTFAGTPFCIITYLAVPTNLTITVSSVNFSVAHDAAAATFNYSCSGY